jgi:gamma-glutamyltranspeptidase / glutathione hydrolase
MAPSLAVGDEGIALAIGAAGGTRLRTALVGVAAGILDEGLEPVEAVERPRFHRAGPVLNAEPGVDEQALDELEDSGLQVRRWSAQHHYFGGVSLLSLAGAAGDPRRSGHAAILPAGR